jgi:hypothetical protein
MRGQKEIETRTNHLMNGIAAECIEIVDSVAAYKPNRARECSIELAGIIFLLSS